MSAKVSHTPSILVVRMDRLGDVILSLPAVQRLRQHLPDARIDFACPALYHETLQPLLQQWKVGVTAMEPERWKQKGYGAALVLFADRQTHWALMGAGIPIRVGLYSKWWSFLFLTAGRRQHRSTGAKNEALYNLELADRLLERLTVARMAVSDPKITIPEVDNVAAEAEAYLKTAGVKDLKRLAVVHPGMGGSALNLSPESYLQAVAVLEQKGFEVAISIGPLERDQELLRAFAAKRPDLPVLQNQPLPRLREIFRWAQMVMAPSTGPLHLAHYVGTTTIGLYSPVKSHSPARWAPWGGAGQSWVLVPEAPCEARKECLGKTCAHYFCFEKTDWAAKLAQLALPSVV